MEIKNNCAIIKNTFDNKTLKNMVNYQLYNYYIHFAI